MFKNLKNIFIVEEEGGDKKSPKTEQKSTSKGKKTTKNTTKEKEEIAPPPPVTAPLVQQPTAGKVNQKFLDILFGALEKNNLEGLDYLEFKQSLNALSNMPMDEQTRYKSAFAMAQSMGAAPNKLIETARYYLKILSQEEKKFGQALEQQTKAKVGQQQMEIKSMSESLKVKAEQIKKLTQEIDSIQKKMNSKKKTIEAATAKITQTKNDFEASYTLLKGQIEDDITNMQQYLGNDNQPKEEPKK